MINVLGLALYGPLAASNRFRLGHYVAGLAEHGIQLEVSSLLGDDYIRSKFDNSSFSWSAMLAAGFERLGEIRRSQYDLILLHCELFPLMPSWLETAILRGKSYIYDFDDAFYLKYRQGRMGKLKPILGSKFDAVMKNAAAITAGNSILQNYAGKFNPQTTLLPTVVDTDRYIPIKKPRDGIFTVGWIGSPSTAPYLEEVKESLSLLGREGYVRLVVIGGKAPIIEGVEVVEIPWSESTEIGLINDFDVGIMPMPDDEWSRGKCAFKLIQYMACGIPVIGSRIGANIDVVTPECGFLVSTGGEWLDALRSIRDEASLAYKMGLAGRLRVEQNFSLRRNIPILAEVINRVAESRACVA